MKLVTTKESTEQYQKNVKGYYKAKASGITGGILEGVFDFIILLFICYIVGNLGLGLLAWLVEGTFDASIVVDWLD